MDEWKRFANAAVQEELIARTEALRAKIRLRHARRRQAGGLEKAARELHEIQERWKQAAEAPRAQAQALWHRYRQAADPIQTKAREFFAQRVEERNGNLERKLALIERAEALADSTDWIKTADELKKLQAEWQADRSGAAAGHAGRRGSGSATRAIRFFTRRNADLAERKETWAANLAKKEALCARAEELAASTRVGAGRERDPPAAGRMEERRARCAATSPRRCGSGSAPRATRSSIATSGATRSSSKPSRRIAKRWSAELESLAPAAPAAKPREWTRRRRTAPAQRRALRPMDAALLERVRSLRSRWNQSTPVVRQGADPLSARFMGALERLHGRPTRTRSAGTELDVDANRQKMEKLCAARRGLPGRCRPQRPPARRRRSPRCCARRCSNTIGGRAGEESKWRAMAEDVRQRAGGVDPSRPRARRRRPRSSPSASTARAAGSSISSAATCRSRSRSRARQASRSEIETTCRSSSLVARRSAKPADA